MEDDADEDNLVLEPALGNNLSLDSLQESDINPSDIEQEQSWALNTFFVFKY